MKILSLTFAGIVLIKLKMDELRQTIISDTEILVTKSRFGLFSQPPPLAIGDEPLFKQKQARRGEDGKPLVKPRNMLAGSNRSGVDKKSYITAPESIHAGDRYLDPEKVDLKYNKMFHTRSTIHELEFKPASGRKSMAELPYHHIDENPIPKNKPARAETGKVITRQRNIQTNPMHKIHIDLFKNPPYVSDPLERKEILQAKQRAQSRLKMPVEMMRTMSHGDILFSSVKEVYGSDDRAQELMSTNRAPFVQSAPRKFRHQSSFKLARRGHGDPIGKYPLFIIPTTTIKSELVQSARASKQKKEKQEWKPNSNRRPISRPTPSISCSAINLRRMM